MWQSKAIEEHRQGSQHGLFSGEVRDKIEKAGKPLGFLRLTIVEAQDLLAKDSAESGSYAGSSDPYVEVHCGKSYWRTTTVDKTCDPSWEGGGSRQEMEIPFDSFDTCVHLLLFDYDRFSSDDYLGEILLPVGALRAEAERDVWLKVQAPPLHDEPITGYLRVRFSMHQPDGRLASS